MAQVFAIAFSRILEMWGLGIIYILLSSWMSREKGGFRCISLSSIALREIKGGK